MSVVTAAQTVDTGTVSALFGRDDDATIYSVNQGSAPETRKPEAVVFVCGREHVNVGFSAFLGETSVTVSLLPN